MEIIIQSDPASACDLAARMVADVIRTQHAPVLGLATGRTPILLYEKLVDLHRAGALSFRSVTTFNLDEYVGLAKNHSGSCHAFMTRHLFDRVDIDQANVFTPDGSAEDVNAACLDYERAIVAKGGIDQDIDPGDETRQCP